MFRTLEITALTNLSARFLLPAGIWKGIYFAYDGDAADGETAAQADLGTIRRIVNGVQKDHVDVDMLADMNALEFGAVEQSSTESSTFRFSAFLPFFHPLDEDVAYFVPSGKRVEIVCDFPTIGGKIDSGNFYAFGVEAGRNAVCPYEPLWTKYDLTYGAAGTPPKELNLDNIAKIYVEKDAQLTHIYLESDNKPIFDTVEVDNIVGYNAIANKIETFSATPDLLVLDLAPDGHPLSALSDQAKLSLTVAAACTVKILVLTLHPSTLKFRGSINYRNQRINAKLRDKSFKGIKAAVDFLQAEKA